MTVTSWRIVKGQHVKNAFTGEGAALNPGRWNQLDQRAVYTAEHRSLAVLEIFVHLPRALRPHDQMVNYYLLNATFDTRLIEELDVAALPGDWRTDVIGKATRQLGQSWRAEQRSAVLRVPSAVIVEESNYLLNPAHPDFGQIELGTPTQFEFDPRLIG